MRILVVDDSKTIRQVVATCLKPMGHEVVFSETGEQAIAYVSENSVDLILMDVEMPGMSGIQVTIQIRETKKDDWFPIIFLTSHTDDESFSDGILAGGDAYLAKPINELRLQLTVVAMERIYVMRQKLKSAQLELELVNQKLEQLSFFDELTGLANRRHFDLALDKQFALSKRQKTPLSLIICDIDYFKNYNDSFGHQQGDRCLAKVAGIIKCQANRPMDLTCRYGGEEFTVILPDTALQGAMFIAEKIRTGVVDAAIAHPDSKVTHTVTISLGLSTYTGQFQNSEELLRVADDALYRAKLNGRNKVKCLLANS